MVVLFIFNQIVKVPFELTSKNNRTHGGLHRSASATAEQDFDEQEWRSTEQQTQIDDEVRHHATIEREETTISCPHIISSE